MASGFHVDLPASARFHRCAVIVVAGCGTFSDVLAAIHRANDSIHRLRWAGHLVGEQRHQQGPTGGASAGAASVGFRYRYEANNQTYA